jgi:polyhydroxybutyrate depolymerase
MPRGEGAMKDFAGCLIPIIGAALLSCTCGCVRTPGTPTSTAAPPIESGGIERTLTVGGLTRTYLLHMPPGFGSPGALPVVFVFHGFAQSGETARQYTGFDEIADSAGFVVVYPNGTGSKPSWNAGGCCGYAVIEEVDDAAFVRHILSDVGAVTSIDPKRIYATGFANGAMLTYRLACEMSDTFAAIAPVAGVLFYYGRCQPEQPVSVIHIHGLDDPDVPFAGDGLSGFGQQYPPVEYGISTWARLDGCSGLAQVEIHGRLTHTTYEPCRAGTAIELYKISGMGHAWPEPSEDSLDASRIIWRFFAAHPKP